MHTIAPSMLGHTSPGFQGVIVCIVVLWVETVWSCRYIYQLSAGRCCLCLQNQIEYVKGVLKLSRQFARKVASEVKLEVLSKHGLDHVFQLG